MPGRTWGGRVVHGWAGGGATLGAVRWGVLTSSRDCFGLVGLQVAPAVTPHVPKHPRLGRFGKIEDIEDIGKILQLADKQGPGAALPSALFHSILVI